MGPDSVRAAASQDLYREYRSGMGGGNRAPYLRAFVRAHFPRQRTARIVDLGCGTGALLDALQAEGYTNLEGVDDSPSQVRSATHPGVCRGDLLQFLDSQGDATVDVVVTFDVIEHLPREILLVLGASVRRVLRPGGRWIVHAPNAAGIFGGRVRYADLTHEQAFTADSLHQLGHRFGFPRVTFHEDRPVPHGVRSLARRILWEALRIPFLLLWAAETGTVRPVILSQNLTAVLYAAEGDESR